MRYHYTNNHEYYSIFGETYVCNHPVYSECTLSRIGDRGLAVIQQRYNCDEKSTYWTAIDPYLTGELYLSPKFRDYFETHSGTCTNGLYPTVTIRKIMWGLRMKPLPKYRWETVFDHQFV